MLELILRILFGFNRSYIVLDEPNCKSILTHISASWIIVVWMKTATVYTCIFLMFLLYIAYNLENKHIIIIIIIIIKSIFVHAGRPWNQNHIRFIFKSRKMVGLFIPEYLFCPSREWKRTKITTLSYFIIEYLPKIAVFNIYMTYPQIPTVRLMLLMLKILRSSANVRLGWVGV